ncbi:hypothetical protein FRD01_15710 [Microvenator marinus]|jgi:hypothetical protein|uniref:Uncharacterized protein n=1 Tax=Microvenator marinus TaxID=2600177 RepID=A0A5B8XSY6_9DELT|nr:hypothetical protein [Microvenator marinus]QED28655.1 hypothetical protein FRD01_15710 [Microvenator marinus]
MSLHVERTAADLSAIPANFKQHLEPGAPPQMKMMAAKGMLPLPPEQTLLILYTVAQTDDQSIREAATKSVKDMPPEIFNAAARTVKHEGVLDWLADYRTDEAGLEAMLANATMSGLTVARLARRAPVKVTEIIATNQVRLLATPQIIEQLYLNPNARAATVDRVVELAHRNKIKLEGIPGLSTALDSGQDIFSGGVDAEHFDKVVNWDQHQLKAKDKGAKVPDPDSADEEEIDDEVERTLAAQIAVMSISQKIRLASVGSREAVHILVRDANRLVHNAAVTNPRVQYTDAKLWANNKSMPDAVIAYISQNRDWTRHYDIQKALVENPKTPLDKTLSFLNFLRTNDLKQLQNNRNIPSQVARQAKTLYAKRTSGQKR